MSIYAKINLIPFILIIMFGYLDEFHQSFVPGRHPSGKDLAADILGGLGGILTYSLILNRSKDNSGGRPEESSTPF